MKKLNTGGHYCIIKFATIEYIHLNDYYEMFLCILLQNKLFYLFTIYINMRYIVQHTNKISISISFHFLQRQKGKKSCNCKSSKLKYQLAQQFAINGTVVDCYLGSNQRSYKQTSALLDGREFTAGIVKLNKISWLCRSQILGRINYYHFIKLTVSYHLLNTCTYSCKLSPFTQKLLQSTHEGCYRDPQ